ncbi:PorV/PorQ family protein [bacterium]|nr:PorV/PorQ family protein [bacterium]
MKAIPKTTTLLLLLALCAVLPASGQGVDKIAQTGMKWLSIPVGARAAALGSAYTAMATDAGAAFWNPAGLALAEGHHVFLNQTQWIADIDVNAASATYAAGDIGTFGVHFITVDWGNLYGTRFTSGAGLYEETGTFSPESWVLGVSFARRVSNKFSFGGTLKFLHENLGNSLEGSFASPERFNARMNVMAIDFGTIFYTGYKDLRIAMAMQNVSQEKEYRFEAFPLPLNFKFGVAMNLLQLVQEAASDQSVTVSVDAIHPRDFSERLHFGVEYSFKKAFFLRTGYKTNYDEEDVTVGGGARLTMGQTAFGLDYSYLAFDNFDAVHMFSFDFEF